MSHRENASSPWLDYKCVDKTWRHIAPSFSMTGSSWQEIGPCQTAITPPPPPTESNIWEKDGSNVFLKDETNNVGIGTDNPSAKLTVRDDNLQVRAYSRNNTSSVFWGMNSIYSYGFGIGDDHKGHVFQNINGPSSVMTFDNSKVGIGTTTPSHTLDVNGFTKITASETLGNDVLQLAYPSLVNGRNHYMFFANRFFPGSSTSMYSVIGAYSQEPNSLGLNNQEGPQTLILQPQIRGGNLGVGYFKKTPSAKLTIAPGSNHKAFSILNYSGNKDVCTIYKNGVIHPKGINFAPNHKLNFGTDDPSTGSLIIQNAKCCYNTYADIKGNLYFRTEASQATLGIQKDATVTIGVWPKYDNTVANTDGHKLMVNGGILCEKVKVIGDVPNSDHVFEKDYELKSLTDLKEFVESNKHLPEIPSAKEFQENGYSIGEMDDLLLRKVEELTLYLLQLKEEIDTLKTENSILKKNVAR